MFGPKTTMFILKILILPVHILQIYQNTSVQCIFLPLKTKIKKKLFDLARTRTWNPLIRSQMPYPLGHKADVENKITKSGLSPIYPNVTLRS